MMTPKATEPLSRRRIEQLRAELRHLDRIQADLRETEQKIQRKRAVLERLLRTQPLPSQRFLRLVATESPEATLRR